jgi:hypothetical protein
MSVRRQKLHIHGVRVVSAFPPIAIKSRTSRHFGFGPKPEIGDAVNKGFGKDCTHRVTPDRFPGLLLGRKQVV